MKITVKTGLILAAIWILIKMSMYWSGMIDSQIPGALINILCLLTAITIGVILSKLRNKDATSALADIKDGMAAGLPYTIVISVFLFLFYGKIDPGFTQHKVAERLAATEKKLNDDKIWAEFKRENRDFETYTKEQFYDEEKVKIEAANNPKSIMIMSLLGGLMLGTLYSILVTIILRRIVFRNARN
ncbi:MAG: DUF4199 family protein [Crocinitomicaceae bacterium]|nr:DUF4199 family protein [Crocinitomicaceae bacterium]